MRERLRFAAAVLGVAFLWACSSSSNSSNPPATQYQLGGTVTGLPASGSLVLQDNGGDDLTVSANGPFTFAKKLADKATYAVTVASSPSGYACTVANGSGTITAADVSNVAVTCARSTFTVGGTVAGLPPSQSVVLQNNGGDNLTVSANGAFTFATPVAQGSAYSVTVLASPSGYRCTPTGNTGTVASANVTTVTVTCAAVTYTVGGTVTGLPASSSIVLRNNGGDTLTVSANGPFTFATGLANGASYSVTVLTAPAGQICTATNNTGIIAAANVTSVAVTCSASPVVQSWSAPTTWGARWPRTDTMVHHAWFDGSAIVEDPNIPSAARIRWTAQGSPVAQRAFTGFPAPENQRQGAGPFAVGQRFEAAAGSDGALDALTGNMIACAVFKPDFNPTNPAGDEFEKPILARGEGHDTTATAGGGWALMQMHSFFCFHYEYMGSDGQTKLAMAIVPTNFADQNVPGRGPLNPSYVVFCAGRNGDTIYGAVNGVPTDLRTQAEALTAPGPITLDRGSHPLTIGGFAGVTDPERHAFPGRVYETAVWNEPATLANLQAKFDAMQGLVAGAQYYRNREGWFTGPDGNLHAVGANAPRIDATRGLLFGLQGGWNRVSRATTEPNPVLNPSGLTYLWAPGEDMSLWTLNGGATVAATGTVEPPGDSERSSSKLVTLPQGATLQTTLGAFETNGPIHGQIWLRVPSAQTGGLRLRVTNPNAGGSATFNIDLGTVAPNTWTRVWLHRGTGAEGDGLTTDGLAGGDFFIEAAPTNTGPVSFYAWGVDLTQIGTLPTPNDGQGGVDLGAFDPGQAMYDYSPGWDQMGLDLPRNPVDGLVLPPVPASTAANGFCISASASTPAGMAWADPPRLFTRSRTIAAWASDPLASVPGTTAVLYVDGARTTTSTPNAGQLCFGVMTGDAMSMGPVCAPMPASFTAGSAHTVKACMAAAPGPSQMRLYVDASTTPIATANGSAAAPDLANGSVIVGSARVQPVFLANPWQGYVSKVAVCSDPGAAGIGNCQ